VIPVALAKVIKINPKEGDQDQAKKKAIKIRLKRRRL